jgi:TonB family protein
MPELSAPVEQRATAPAERAEVTALVLINPRLVTRPAPRYPVAAVRHRRSATVTVRVLIGADGRVEETERIGPKAGMGFDRAAEDAALASTWQPGTRGGEPVAMWAELHFEFKP